MENVSKVVLIAGAILIILAVISVAIYVTFMGNETLNVVGDNAVNNTERVSQINKFIKYKGTGITGAQVKECISAAIAHNSNVDNINLATSVRVGGTLYVNRNSYNINGGRIGNVDTISTNINNSNIYTGTINYLANVGTIDAIDFN